MPAPEQINLDHVAALARLALTPEEKTRFASQLGDVLGYIEQLKQVDVEGVEPTAHATPIFNVLQADEARPGLSAEDAVRNAPDRREAFFVVPRVVE